jgi:hypothetical protein
MSGNSQDAEVVANANQEKQYYVGIEVGEPELKFIDVSAIVKNMEFGSEFSIGRADTSDLVLSKEEVSRRHVLIVAGKDGQFSVQSSATNPSLFVEVDPALADIADVSDETIPRHQLVEALASQAVENTVESDEEPQAEVPEEEVTHEDAIDPAIRFESMIEQTGLRTVLKEVENFGQNISQRSFQSQTLIDDEMQRVSALRRAFSEAAYQGPMAGNRLSDNQDIVRRARRELETTAQTISGLVRVEQTVDAETRRIGMQITNSAEGINPREFEDSTIEQRRAKQLAGGLDEVRGAFTQLRGIGIDDSIKKAMHYTSRLSDSLAYSGTTVHDIEQDLVGFTRALQDLADAQGLRGRFGRITIDRIGEIGNLLR